jgi:hypothetical protein
MKLKELHFADVAEIQVSVTDELNRVQKEEFSEAFQKLYDRSKACIHLPVELILNKKKVCVFLMCHRFKKKVSPETFRPHYVHVQTESDFVTKHNFGNKEIHRKWAAHFPVICFNSSYF